jgi:uncharacterized membrane protein
MPQEVAVVLDIFALVVFGVLIVVVIWLVVILGPIPGNIARKRGHPQADAIKALGWIGMITLGLAWPIALVWAYTRSGEQHADYLSERVATLEAELSAMKIQGGDA